MHKSKAFFRKTSRHALEGLTMKSIELKSEFIAQNLYGQNLWKEAEEVLLFLHFGREVQTHRIIEAALGQEKRVYAPVIQEREIRFYPVYHHEGPFSVNKYGIKEPPVDNPPFHGNSSSTPLMLLPGLCFDRKGGRIGYGGGFYDRFLNSHRGLKKVGLTFAELVYPAVPCEDYDHPVDTLITDQEILTFT